MKKKTIIDIYAFLSHGIRMSALSDPQVRSSFITFFRGIKGIADSVLKELEAAQEPPLDGASEETRSQIFGEDVRGDLPKIKEDYLLEVIAGSGIDIPLNEVLVVFGPLTE
ncbi:MAG: hypothetical protein IKW99_03440 [Bacteroidales bacterium]|nr:hypothetical protein [Bacteroidales bacterium]